MADRATEVLDIMEVQQLTPTAYLKISQAAGRRARQDIPSFGIAERQQAPEATRICAFWALRGRSGTAAMPMGASATGAADLPMAAAAGHSPR